MYAYPYTLLLHRYVWYGIQVLFILLFSITSSAVYSCMCVNKYISAEMFSVFVVSK